MQTVSQMYENMVLDMIQTLENRMTYLENNLYLTDEDEMELAAIERLLERLNDLEGY